MLKVALAEFFFRSPPVFVDKPEAVLAVCFLVVFAGDDHACAFFVLSTGAQTQGLPESILTVKTEGALQFSS